jgi:hypothetical protein
MVNVKFASILVTLFSLTGCANKNNIEPKSDVLIEFAEANCLFWYFKSKDYDTSDIRKISAGIVSLSTYSAEKFQKTAFLVKEYSPVISSKGNIDVELAKCFVLKEDKVFAENLDLIRKL